MLAQIDPINRFDLFWSELYFLRQLGQKAKFTLAYNQTTNKFNQVKHVEIHGTHYKVRFTVLDQCRMMIIFESLLTPIEASLIFWGSWGSSKNRLEPKIEPP